MQSSSDRGQTEPLAALVAIFALGIGLSVYVGVLDSTLPLLTEESDITPTAADKLVVEASPFGVVHPPIGDATNAARPNGYAINATVRADGRLWQGGSPRVETADCVTRRISVRIAPATVRPGTLEVCAWPEP